MPGGDAAGIPFLDEAVLRVLFLDFDGVLHAAYGPSELMRRFCWAPILEQLIQGKDRIGIVIHASAREYSSAGFLASQLGGLGQHVIDIAPPRLPRWTAIREWLQRHQECTDYCILDDAPSEFPPALAQLIVCHPRHGLNDEKVQCRIKEWINKSNEYAHTVP